MPKDIIRRAPRNGAPTSSRGLRVEDSVWFAARARAQKEGVSVNHAMVRLLSAYASGRIDLPRAVRPDVAPAS